MSKASISVHNQLATQSQEGNGIDIRVSSTAFLGISANDRFPVGATNSAASISPYNFTLSSNQNLLAGYFTRIGLTELDFTWSIPTITTDRNDTIAIFYNGSSTTITIPGGWYTPTTLAAALQAAIRTAVLGAGAFTLTYSTTNYRFEAASTTPSTFEFRRAISPNNSEYGRISLYEMMNWNPATSNDGLTFTTEVSGNPTMLSTPFVDFVCAGLTANQGLKDADTGSITRSIICRLFLMPEGYLGDPALIGSAPFRIVRQFSNPKEIKWSANQPIGNLGFQVYDSQGYLVGSKGGSLPGGNSDNVVDANKVGWNLSLLVSEV